MRLQPEYEPEETFLPVEEVLPHESMDEAEESLRVAIENNLNISGGSGAASPVGSPRKSGTFQVGGSHLLSGHTADCVCTLP